MSPKGGPRAQSWSPTQAGGPPGGPKSALGAQGGSPIQVGGPPDGLKLASARLAGQGLDKKELS